jgi:tyrosinase
MYNSNVDRLLSIYQALHPSLWLAPDPVYSSGTYAIPDYSTVDASTPLSPFWKSAHDVFYTSDDLRDTLPLGYAYPETRSWLHGENGTNGTRFREAVRKEVSRLYSPDWRAKVQGAGTTRVAPSALLRRGRVSEWAVRISVARGALGASFSVSFFLQPTPGDRREVGRVALLMPEAAEVMMPGEGQGQMGGVVNSTVQLTGKLVDEVVAGRLANLSVHAVGGYLPEKLGWSVVAVSPTYSWWCEGPVSELGADG